MEVEGGSLTALAGFDGHQGIALVVDPRRYASPEEILARAAERGEPPFVLVLDSLEDPQNVGTLLRSAEAAGVHGVIFPTRRQAPLTPAAVKASAGAVEHLLLCPVDDLAGALADLHTHGLRVAGSEADAPLTARQTDLRGPLAIVVGSEGQGLGPASAAAATCSCESRCAAQSGRSTQRSPVPCCSSRQSRSAIPTIAKGRGTIGERHERQASSHPPCRTSQTKASNRSKPPTSGPPADPTPRPNPARGRNLPVAAEPEAAVERDIAAGTRGAAEPEAAADKPELRAERDMTNPNPKPRPNRSLERTRRGRGIGGQSRPGRGLG